MAPRNWKLVRLLLDAIRSFIAEVADKAVTRDLGILRGTRSILDFLYLAGKYSKWVREKLLNLRACLDEMETFPPNGFESPISAPVNKIFFN